MLTRSRQVNFSNGVTIDTPLLVPSLSTRGFEPIVLDRQSFPAPAGYLQAFTPSAFRTALLVSAFDWSNDNLLASDQLRSGFESSPYAEIGLLIIDCGWYESRQGADAGSPYTEPAPDATWNPTRHEETVGRLDSNARPALVSYDRHAPYDEQVERAQEFFANRRNVVRTIMLKPQHWGGYHNLNALTPSIPNLRGFDIIGLSDRELGPSIVKRTAFIASLRRLLDRNGVAGPIHIFGALDPMYSPLYFAAGAEIFDGLSWLRFAYHSGQSIHREAMILIDRAVDMPLDRAISLVQVRNLMELENLGRDLRIVHQEQRFTVLRQADIIGRAFQACESEWDRPDG